MSSINRRDFGILVVATALLPVGAALAEDAADPWPCTSTISCSSRPSSR